MGLRQNRQCSEERGRTRRLSSHLRSHIRLCFWFQIVPVQSTRVNPTNPSRSRKSSRPLAMLRRAVCAVPLKWGWQVVRARLQLVLFRQRSLAETCVPIFSHSRSAHIAPTCLSRHEPLCACSTSTMPVRQLFCGFEGGGRIGAGLPFADLASNLPDSFGMVSPLPCSASRPASP